MDYTKINKLASIFYKGASGNSAQSFFRNYEKLSDAIEDLNYGLASWYVEGFKEFGDNIKDKEEYMELTDKAHELFFNATNSIKPQLEAIESEMDRVFDNNLSKLETSNKDIA